MTDIRSQINPPAKKLKVKLPDPPEKATTNLIKESSASTALLQFHVPIEIKREFKIMAAEQDISQTRLFLDMLEKYKNILS